MVASPRARSECAQGERLHGSGTLMTGWNYFPISTGSGQQLSTASPNANEAGPAALVYLGPLVLHHPAQQAKLFAQSLWYVCCQKKKKAYGT
jgi:hypothetical protein